jgi:alkanesulfonate monooxygenase SsuD/methylene tetrahydromethanopterin reductase-like flavin-dependent oxidoreductase (luciferase family)
MGLPYVFANHFAGDGLERALDLYRQQFQPSETLAAPRTFLTANAVAADTAEVADAAMLPQARMMARLRGNRPLVPLETVEEAASAEAVDHLATSMLDSLRERWFVGTGPEVRARLTAFATTHGVDEVMISPVAGATADEPMDAGTSRIRTLELLAA